MIIGATRLVSLCLQRLQSAGDHKSRRPQLLDVLANVPSSSSFPFKKDSTNLTTPRAMLVEDQIRRWEVRDQAPNLPQHAARRPNVQDDLRVQRERTTDNGLPSSRHQNRLGVGCGACIPKEACQSKLAGILYCLTAIDWLIEVRSIKQGEATHGCDGLQTVHRSFADANLLDPKQAQFDLLLAMCGLRRQCRVIWHTHHVKGHQDNNVMWSSLDWWARGKIVMDQSAQRGRHRLEPSGATEAPNPWFPSEPWVLCFHGGEHAQMTADMVDERKHISHVSGLLLRH
jgi:hypothetical protein